MRLTFVVDSVRSNRGWLFVTEQKVVRAFNQADGALVWQYGHNAIHGRHQGAHRRPARSHVVLCDALFSLGGE